MVLTFAGVAVLWAASLAGLLEPLPETATSAAESVSLARALVVKASVLYQADTCAACPTDRIPIQ